MDVGTQSLLGRGGKYTKLHITGKKRRFGNKKYQLKLKLLK